MYICPDLFTREIDLKIHLIFKNSNTLSLIINKIFNFLRYSINQLFLVKKLFFILLLKIDFLVPNLSYLKSISSKNQIN